MLPSKVISPQQIAVFTTGFPLASFAGAINHFFGDLAGR